MFPLQTQPCTTNYFIWGHACFCASHSKDNSEWCFNFQVQLHEDREQKWRLFLFPILLECSFLLISLLPKIHNPQFSIAPVVVCHYCWVIAGETLWNIRPIVLIADWLHWEQMSLSFLDSKIIILTNLTSTVSFIRLATHFKGWKFWLEVSFIL